MTTQSTPASSASEAAATLGVPAGATRVQLDDALRAGRIRWHPDRHGPKDKDYARSMYDRIEQAYDYLLQELTSGSADSALRSPCTGLHERAARDGFYDGTPPSKIKSLLSDLFQQ
jgi:DnaJ-class molecular chaperone